MVKQEDVDFEMGETFSPLWDELIQLGMEAESEDDTIAHTMSIVQMNGFFQTIDLDSPCGVSDPMAMNAIAMTDLNTFQYRVFDLLGMCMGGRWGDELKGWANVCAVAYIKTCKDDNHINRHTFYDNLIVNIQEWYENYYKNKGL